MNFIGDRLFPKIAMMGGAAIILMTPDHPAKAAPNGPACSLEAHGEHTSLDIKEIGWMQLGEQLVRDKLKDPDSARFKDVYFCRGRHKVPVTCGWVNAKNSFGGYGGFERFMSPGRPDLTALESQVSHFSSVWREFCKSGD